ncbi:flagellar basal body P-ring protein FlgI [Denitrobaculum tricleocarpae]|uniref:Flagellar P-ring protein n=1 Tax=Denitrobaculum tricleocarpae TaxID=2591009 RepID=A0A545T239_9PROT|nr:flagellar basal body P-ring protein FlgI [Denitrobaculum tricleocarpae]TQV71281.1 flagellar basal body P-ring protein FlgI [Denitrobaculum tricleocarpae]
MFQQVQKFYSGTIATAAKTARLTAKRLVVSVLLLCIAGPAAAQMQHRIKDIADFEGIRENMLVGYGLVVGLNGTGDDLGSAVFTRESLIGMLERLGVNARDAALDTDNVAAVMITADLPPFSRQGTRLDVTVSAIGDSESLLGGTLLVTPLLAADGEVYAVAQGAVAIAGFSAGGNAETITRGVPTVGRIANGAIIERELDFELSKLRSVKVALRNPDLTTARRIASTINTFLKAPAARSLDPATVQVAVPDSYDGDAVAMLTDIEQLRVTTDQVARVLIDERSGVIVMGENVRISTVAIAQGNLTIRVTETPQVSQPNAFANTGDTEVVDRTTIEVDEDADRRLAVLPSGISLQEMVNGLNALGVGPRDMITILQSIKAAGALQAEIEVM